MITTIIFDCFGVLATDHWRAFCQKHIAPIPGALEDVQQLNHDVDAGKISFDDFIRRTSERTGLDEEAIRSGMQIGNPNTELLDYIQAKIAPSYTIGMLSNAPDNWLDKILTPEQIALFDDITLSYDVGFAKPKPEIYRLAATRLNVPPEECLFVDDQQKNCDGATQVGMHPILFTDLSSLRTSLSQLVAQHQ